MPRIAPLNDALRIETYALHKCVTFSLEIPPDTASDLPEEVSIPIAIVHRLHHLGRAFDGQAVKLLAPQGMYRIGYIDAQRLISELVLVETAVSDPVTQHYLAKLLPLLRRSSAAPTSAIRVVEK